MNFFFDKIPLVVLIVGICMLMLYPYIGAGLMLAALCFRAERYGLMAACFVICILLQSIMGKRILTHHVDVGPSRASQKKEEKGKPPKKRRRKKKKVQGVPVSEGAEVQETAEVPEVEAAESQEVPEVPTAKEVIEIQEVTEDSAVPITDGYMANNEAPENIDVTVPEETNIPEAAEMSDAGVQEVTDLAEAAAEVQGTQEVTDLPVAGVGVE